MALRLRSIWIVLLCAGSQALASQATHSGRTQAAVGGIDVAALCFVAAGAGLMFLRRTHKKRRSSE
jgi:hypothetical protein